MHIYVLCGLFFCYQVVAQKISIEKIEDNRSSSENSFFSRCEIELKISGDEARRYKYVKLAKLTKAEDDQGFDLIHEKSETYDYQAIDEVGKVQVKLRNPSRKAAQIKELSGEITLFNPTEANGAIIKVPNYQAKTNKNLLPASMGLKMLYLTPESVKKFAEEQKKKTQAELAKLPDVERKLADGIMELVDAFGSFGDDENKVTFLLEGDESKLVDVYFQGADGKKIERNGSMSSSNQRSFYFSQKPLSSWTLVILAESDKAIKTIPFKLKDIDLP